MTTDFTFTFGSGPSRRRRETEVPRFLVLADFAGRKQGKQSFAARRITVDNLDATLAEVEPVLRIPSPVDPHAAQGLPISSLDHFHPDYLVAALPHLRQLLELKMKLDKPASEQAALAELDALIGATDDVGESPKPTQPAAAEGSDELLGRLLGRGKSEGGNDRARDRVNELIKRAFDANAAAASSSRAKDGGRRIVELLEQRMRQVLADAEFRAVERAWRSVHLLLTRIEDEQAEIHVLDVSKAALAAHLAEFLPRLDTSPLHRTLADDANGGWDLIVGDYSFGASAEDLVLLATIGALAARAEARFIAHGELALAGCTSDGAVDSPWDWRVDEEVGALWNDFRAHPAARWVSLAAPRFLLRHPYGAKNDPITRFEFEELAPRPARDAFFWGNPAFACALLAAGAAATGDGGVGDLPMPTYRDGTGEAIQTPLEVNLGERARTAVGERGLIAFAGGHNTNRIATAALRSVAAD
jgi:type VI secretion system protein ImpC